MGTPALGLAQDAAPRACDRECRWLFTCVRDLEPSSQDRGAIEFGVNFDRDGSNRVMQSDGGLRISVVRGRLLQAAPLPIRSQLLTVNFQPESLGHVIFGGI